MQRNVAQMYNVTFEDLPIQLAGKGFRFKARSFCEVPWMDFKLGLEDIPLILEKDYGHRGIFYVNEEEDFKALEYKALQRYLETLDQRIKNFEAEALDWEKKGKKPFERKESKKYRVWAEQVRAKLMIEAPEEDIPSFLSDEPTQKQNVKVRPVVIKRAGRPQINKESFLEEASTNV